MHVWPNTIGCQLCICKKCSCVFVHHYTFDDDSERPIGYELFLLPKILSYLVKSGFVNTPLNHVKHHITKPDIEMYYFPKHHNLARFECSECMDTWKLQSSKVHTTYSLAISKQLSKWG